MACCPCSILVEARKLWDGDGADRGKRILDAMMQFAKDQFLQLVGGLALLGVDAGLLEQQFGVDAGLFQQEAEAVVFG